MTLDDLIKMCGSKEQADFAVEIILKSIKPAFVRQMVQAEISAVKAEIEEMKKAGFIVSNNGIESVNWAIEAKLNGWNLSADQQTAHDDAFEKCAHCENLLYKKNRLVSLIAVR